MTVNIFYACQQHSTTLAQTFSHRRQSLEFWRMFEQSPLLIIRWCRVRLTGGPPNKRRSVRTAAFFFFPRYQTFSRWMNFVAVRNLNFIVMRRRLLPSSSTRSATRKFLLSELNYSQLGIIHLRDGEVVIYRRNHSPVRHCRLNVKTACGKANNHSLFTWKRYYCSISICRNAALPRREKRHRQTHVFKKKQ